MITHEKQPDGTERELSLEERRRVNQKVLGLDEQEQLFIEAIESGEIDGDLVALDDAGNRIVTTPRPAPWLGRGTD